MANQDYVLLMARYNMWQNENLIKAASGLDQAAREAERGAFFGSIEKTFSHLLWGDGIWLSRFEGRDPPASYKTESTALIETWDGFQQDRAALDRQILDWARAVPSEWFEGDLTWYSGLSGSTASRPKKMLAVQLFNHQTHHRGQIHAMLTAAGARPDATDIQAIPDRFLEM
ncbi:MAG: damage-inducible protein DinB [Hoeflea sp.]|uniref:DinB family protein n=1 Tax=Hoeflea sp. TaxID=1940281 RepID=UPI000C1091C8|nr:DinB family protein [Hoeflea sp.]PHR24324.1 MAG: damage-inducible protein DinB [Hoeflea sp.]